MTNEELERYQKDWVGFQRYLINETFRSDFPYNFCCVDWATMRIALMANERDAHADWHTDFLRRVQEQDSFSLEELRQALP